MNKRTHKIILIAVVLTATSCFNKRKPAASDSKETVQAPEPTEIPTSKEALLAPFEAIKKEKPIDTLYVYEKDGNIRTQILIYPTKKLKITYCNSRCWGGDPKEIDHMEMEYLNKHKQIKKIVKLNYFNNALTSIYESEPLDTIFKNYTYSSLDNALAGYYKYNAKGLVLYQFYMYNSIADEEIYTHTENNKIIKDIRQYYPYVKITQEICEPTQGWGMKCPSDPAYGDSKLIEALAIFRGMLGEQ